MIFIDVVAHCFHTGFHHARNHTYIFTLIYSHLYAENQTELRKLANNSQYENPKMAKLESVLLKQFHPDEQSRGILFSKTRISTHCLSDWVINNKALQEAGIKAAFFTGAGNGINSMTLVC